jgi:hypothetical protein
MKGYTTEAKIENYLLQDIDASFSSQIESWIEGVERIIDNYTGRDFIADTTASARVYDGDGEQDLLIDDCIEVTKVEVGADDYGGSFTEVSSSGADRYFLDPPNAQSLDVKVPYNKVTLRSRYFPEGKQNNRITAKWGYSESVPADVEFAATVFVAGIINQQRQGGDEVKSEKIGNYMVTYNSDRGKNSFADFERAMSILDSYKRLNI